MSKPSSPSLADVQAAFIQWRRTRTTRRTPPALRRHAVGLLAEHRISDVMAALGVDHRRLSRWRREVSALTGSTADGDFIELPMASRPAPVPSVGVSLTLTRQAGDGSALSIAGQLSETQWRWALRLLQETGA